MSYRTEALYFRDITRFQMLTDQQERELVLSVQRKEPGAVNKLITANLRFVVSVAKRYRGRGLTYLELINEGNLGLLKAASRFDLNMNVKFISYAVWWIRQSIQKALFEQAGTVRIPPNKIALIHKFKQALDRNCGDFNKTISMEEFRDQEAEIVDVMEKLRGISLDAPSSGKPDEEPGKHFRMYLVRTRPGWRERKERTGFGSGQCAGEYLKQGRAHTSDVLRAEFPRQFTLEEIGKELSLTRERVRLIRDRSLRKLFQNPMSRAKLTPFFNDSCQ